MKDYPSALPMPPGPDDEYKAIPAAPPSKTRQILQLIVIPALIVLAAVAVAYPILRMFSVKGTIPSQVAVLRRQGGLENDKWRAIHGIASQIDQIKDPAQRQQLNRELLDILDKSEVGDGGKLQLGLVLLLARLDQPGNLQIIARLADSPHAQVRQGVMMSLYRWPDEAEARLALGAMIKLAADKNVLVKGYAVRALGRLARADDPQVMSALRAVLDSDGDDDREASWDAAIALAGFGQPRGESVVAQLLLNRQALSQLSANPTGSAPGLGRGTNMSPAKQDRIILHTLGAAGKMTDPAIWDKINQLADSDANPRVRMIACELRHKQRAGDATKTNDSIQ